MLINNIVTCLSGDATLNAYLTGGLRHNHIDVNSDKTKNWITFSSSIISSEDETNLKGAVQYHNLEIQCISPTDTTVVAMTDRLNTYLNSYDDGYIRNVGLISGDEIDYDFDQKVWFKTMIYDVLFTK
jgi:hypothetical protein